MNIAIIGQIFSWNDVYLTLQNVIRNREKDETRITTHYRQSLIKSTRNSIIDSKIINQITNTQRDK